MNLAELKKEVETAAQPTVELPASVQLGELHRPDPGDGKELIGDRYVCRGGSLMIVGPTGAGKSSMGLQQAVFLGIGKECFGLRPTGKLRSLIIQAENDEGDLYEMREGIFAGCGLSPSDRDTASRNVIISSINDATGLHFITKAERLLTEHKPDLFFIDPLLSYIGGDISRQDVAAQFLREWLTPIVTKANCAVIVMHHPPKPKQDKGDSKSTDDAYYGAGSAELFNWARAVIVLKPSRAHGIYELKLAKRGNRAGWTESDGKTACYTRTIGHGENGLIYWRELGEDDTARGKATPGKTREDILALVPINKPNSRTSAETKRRALSRNCWMLACSMSGASNVREQTRPFP